MKHEYTAIVKKEDDWWIGWIQEIPGVNCQEKTYDELKDTLEVTLKEALDFNRQDALVAAGSGYREEKNRSMKRKELLKYLRSQGCELLREGGKHSWWFNPELNKRSAIPRHSEVKDIVAKKICKDLGVESVR